MKFSINPSLPSQLHVRRNGAPMVFRKYSTPPLGLLTAAAMIPQHHAVTLCDENTSAIDWDADCDVVGLTGMHLQESRIREIAARFRARGKRVVVGGPSVMALPERYADVADIRIVGEAGEIWPEAIVDLENGRARSAYYATKTVDLATSPKPRFDFVSLVLVIAVSTERDLDNARTHQARGEVSIDCRERRLGGVRAA